jgi:hypothetical protein
MERSQHVLTSAIRGFVTLGVASLLLGCHPQGAVVAGPAQLRPLDQELVETALQARIGELAPCLADADVVPGQPARTQHASMQLSITESGHVQSVILQKIDDTDLNECITHKTKSWAFPRGGLTVVDVALRMQARSAEVAGLKIQPVARTADSKR